MCIKIVSEPSQYTNEFASVHVMLSVCSHIFLCLHYLHLQHLECDRTAHFHVNSPSLVCFLLLFHHTIHSYSGQAHMHFEPPSRGFHKAVDLLAYFKWFFCFVIFYSTPQTLDHIKEMHVVDYIILSYQWYVFVLTSVSHVDVSSCTSAV